jgi:ribosomal protein L22
LYDTSLTIQQTHFADQGEADTALKKIEDVLYLIERHAHHEDTGLLPAIEMYEPSIVEKFEDEHVADHQLSARLKHLLNIFRSAQNEPDRLLCGSAISKAFVEFMVFNLDHMAKEEMLINPVLWKEYSDGQIQLLTQKLVANIPAAEKTLSAKWIMRGVNHIEAIQWLKQVKATVPASLFEKILGIAEAELPELTREKVLDGVWEPELAAN